MKTVAACLARILVLASWAWPVLASASNLTLGFERLSRLELTETIDQLEDEWKSAPAYVALARRLELCHSELGWRHRETIEAIYHLGKLSEIADLTGEANELLEVSLALAQESLGPDDPLIPEILIRLGRLWRESRPQFADQVDRYLEQADGLIERIGNPPALRGALLYAQGSQLRVLLQIEAAAALYREALELRHAAFGEHDMQVVNNLVWLAWLERRIGQVDVAEGRLERALESFEKRGFKDHPLRGTTLDLLSQIARGRGQYARAESLASRAIEVADAVRVDQLPTRRHLGVHSRFSLATLLLRRGQEEAAWDAVVPALGPRTRDAFVGRGSRDRDLGRRASKAESRLQRLFSSWQQGESTLLESVVDAIVSTVSLRADLVVDAMKRHRSSHINEVSRLVQLPNGVAMIGWIGVGWDLHEGDQETVVWAYVLRTEDGRSKVTWVPIGEWHDSASYQEWFAPHWERRDRFKAATKWAQGLEFDQRLLEVSEEVSRRIFQPLEDHLAGVHHLVVLPSYGFRALELEGWVGRDGRYLSERFAISYVSSPDLFDSLTSDSEVDDVSQLTALVVGDPAYDGVEREPVSFDSEEIFDTSVGASLLRSVLEGSPGAHQRLPRLVYSSHEATSVAELFGPKSRVLLGRNASEKTLSAMVSDGSISRFGVVHLATHVLYDPKFGNRSALALALSEDESTDGLITHGEIESAWSLDADLVTLSGCQTGPARFYLESGGSFLMPVIAAGASSVLATRWKVDDRATSLLMRRFYENVTGVFEEPRQTPAGTAVPGRLVPKAHALSEATTWLRQFEAPNGSRPFEHPFYWAGFFLFGDPR